MAKGLDLRGAVLLRSYGTVVGTPKGLDALHAERYGGVGMELESVVLVVWGAVEAWYVASSSSSERDCQEGTILHELVRFVRISDSPA